MTTLDRISVAAKAGKIMPGTAENLAAFLAAKLPAWAEQSIEELVAKEAWSELNDRFYRFLEFGLEAVDLETLLRESDLVTMHVVLTKETRHMMSSDQFALIQ